MSNLLQTGYKGAPASARREPRPPVGARPSPAARCAPLPGAPVIPALPLAFPPVIERRGEEYLVRAGKPVAWLTPKQFGTVFGLGPEAIRRKIGSEALPESLVEYNGPRRIRIRADAVDHFRQHWRSRRAMGE
ncbi:MAG TPA: hypothetical protein VMB21_20515 [Candidatus Limnocylindria bacterium]|nr:hypothetical protein [Candidatus Limnocylindria bacterium]